MRPFSVSATGCPWQPKSVAFRRVHNPAIRVATLAACLFATPAAFAQTSEAWDAKFVKMEVPDSVEADAVFVAKVTMENTGSEKWREGRDIVPSSLRSQPDKDMTWGTTIFIQGQGTVVEPGKEHTYSSNLRAPSEPGKYAFQWRLAGGKGLFGEPTPKREITVLPRTTRDDPPAALPKADATGKRPLTPADVEYLGSFKLPAHVGKGGAAYSETGMTLRRSKDGVPRLLITYSPPARALFEADIPELAPFEKGNADGLQTAAAVKEWDGLVSKAGAVGSNAGIAWDEDFQTLYWSHYNGYWTGGDIHVLHASTLNEDGTTTPVGSWKVPRQKWYWGGVTFLPKSFAKRYTDGNTLAIGFGGYFSIVGPCSRGPALSALRRPDPAGEQVTDVVNLLGYPQPDTAAPRPGDYFNVNCGFWNDPPKSRAAGTWTFCDWNRAGVLIDLADVQGFLAFPSLGTGRLGYDYGAITQAGTSQYWYFYDSRQLGEIAQQKRQLGTVAPYIMQEDSGMRGLVTGACFDEATRRLYVLRMQAYWVGRELHPLVHVYQIGKAK